MKGSGIFAVILVVALVLMAGIIYLARSASAPSIDKDKIARLLEKRGYHNVNFVRKRSPLSLVCESNSHAFDFVATDLSGQKVTVLICAATWPNYFFLRLE